MEEGLDLSVQATGEMAKIAVLAGISFSAEDIYAALSAAGVTHGIDTAAINALIAKCPLTEPVSDYPVAQQIAPKPHAPTSIHQRLQNQQLAAPGDLIAEIVADEGGVPGFTVTGDQIEAPSTPGQNLTAGINTEQTGNQICATLYGKVVYEKDSVRVEAPITVAHDKLTATMDITAFSNGEGVITGEDILAALKQATIIEGIDREAIANALNESANSHSTLARVVVARGKEPVAAAPASFEFHFSIDGENPIESQESAKHPKLCLVKDQDILCSVTVEIPAAPGVDIFGQALTPPPAPKAVIAKPHCGPGVEYNDDVHQFIATVNKYGYANFIDGKILITPLLTIADDNMSATLNAHPPAKFGHPLTLEIINQQLSIQGISYGIDQDQIAETLAVVTKDKLYHTAVIAEGKAGKVGCDAYLKPIVAFDQQAGEKREDGSIDYRERGTLVNLEAGAEIGTVVPPEPGEPQVDVLGETSPPIAGKEIDFQPGEGVELKNGIFYSTEAGALQIQKNIVTITDVFQVKGNVDLQVGNLHHQKGSIEISGAVESGFEIKAKAHIAVRQNVDNSTLLAGGDISIGTGYTQAEDDDSYIMAMGDVSLRYALNATIYSYQDITISDSAMNTKMQAKGSIIATQGKGCIIGGSAKAGREIRVKNLGSEAGVITIAEIQPDPKSIKGLRAAIDAEEKAVEHGSGSSARLQDLQKQLREIVDHCRDNGAIIVEGTLYPGVTLKLLDVVYKVSEARKRCKISLSPTKRIQFSNIQ